MLPCSFPFEGLLVSALLPAGLWLLLSFSFLMVAGFALRLLPSGLRRSAARAEPSVVRYGHSGLLRGIAIDAVPASLGTVDVAAGMGGLCAVAAVFLWSVLLVPSLSGGLLFACASPARAAGATLCGSVVHSFAGDHVEKSPRLRCGYGLRGHAQFSGLGVALTASVAW